MKVQRCLQKWGSALLVKCCVLMALVILKSVGDVKCFHILSYRKPFSCVKFKSLAICWHYGFSVSSVVLAYAG